MLKKYTLSILFFIISFHLSFAQTTIYSEDFTGQDGKGAFGPVPLIDLAGVNWSVDVSGATLDQPDDWFYVTNEFFEGRDLDGPAIWLSPLIDITGFTNVQFSLDALDHNGIAGDNLEDADTFITEYRIDGGAWVQALNNGTINNDFDPTVVSDNGLSGNTFELRVIMTNNGTGERHRLDNVIIEGTAPVVPTLIVTPNTIAGLEYVEGDISTQEDIITIQGFNLTNNVTLTVPADFEISTTSGGGFNNTITLTQTGGVVNLTTIYVRLISGLTANVYNNVLTISTAPLTPQTVTLSGEVTAPIADCSQLLISEYHEGAGTEEKYIEIYNPTNAIIDLSNYRLARYVNENTIPNTIDLTGNINPYGTYLISGEFSDLCASGEADLCTNSAVMNFNGDDEMALQTIGGTNIDVIGTIGSSGFFAQDIGLIRNIDVAIPTIVYNAAQWATVASGDTGNLGVHASECLCPNTTIWDGTNWSAGAPNNSTAAIIDGNYTTGPGTPSFTACSLTVNALLTVSNGDFVEVENFVLVNDLGRITTETAGSFVQRGDAEFAGVFKLAPSGNANVSKQTSLLSSNLEYTYWSSPVANITVDEGLTDAEPNRRFTFDAANFVDTVGNGINDAGTPWIIAGGTDIMTPAQGFASTHGGPIFMPARFTYDFEGSYNTGNITYPMFYNNANVLNHWNLIGNPYPSAVDADAFFAANNTVADGVIYLWSQVSPADSANIGNEVLNFSQSDYITINRISSAGVTINGTTPTPAPSRRIPSGQSFFISSLAVGDILFTNSMRVSGNNVNDEFYRTANQSTSTNSVEKFWITLSSEVGIYSQLSVAYADFATDNDDGNSIDTPRNYAGTAGVLYSLDEQGQGFYVIQGKALNGLDTSEVVKLGFGAFISTRETYTLSLADKEGTFLESNTMYLRDNDTGIIHDLTASDYTFEADGGGSADRFEILFSNSVLSVDDIVADDNGLVITELNDGNVQFTIKNSNLTIDAVSIYDIQGRLVYNLEGENSTETYNLSNLNTAAYIAKVTLSNGQTLTKKSIKK